MEELVKSLLKRSDVAFRKLELFRDLYQRAYKLGFPERDGWYTQTAGERKHRDIYDSNFADAWERLTNAIYTGMCPPWATWFQLLPGALIPEEQEDEAMTLLQPHGKAIWRALAQSNYYTALHSTVADIIAGTGHLLTDDHPTKGLHFRSVPIYEVGLESDSFGLCGWFWKRKISARRIPKEFPDAVLPSDLACLCESNPEDEIELVTATIESEDPRYSHQQYVIYAKGNHLLEVRGFYENPWASPRWNVLSGEDYGRGPALKAEPGAYSTNEAAKLMLMAANISLFGMWLVDRERISQGTIQFGAGVTIPVAAQGQDVATAMRPLVPSTKFDLGQYALESMQSQTKRAFYRDNLAAVERPGMTATEVMERQALVAQDMGAAYGRLTNELLQPVLQRVSGILARRGKLPPALSIDGQQVALQYTSALARAQQYEEVVGMRAFLQDVANLAAFDPSAKFMINAPKFGRKLAGLTGVDLGVTRAESEVALLAENAAQAEAELMRMQGAPQGPMAPDDGMASRDVMGE